MARVSCLFHCYSFPIYFFVFGGTFFLPRPRQLIVLKYFLAPLFKYALIAGIIVWMEWILTFSDKQNYFAYLIHQSFKNTFCDRPWDWWNISQAAAHTSEQENKNNHKNTSRRCDDRGWQSFLCSRAAWITLKSTTALTS